jgi:hypothetical protein
MILFEHMFDTLSSQQPRLYRNTRLRIFGYEYSGEELS